MADPLTAIGAAASVAQLADVALRLIKELYGFFWELKDSKEQVRQHVITLQDVHAAIQVLRDHIYRVNRSSNPNIPASLIECLRGLFEEMSAARKLLPHNALSVSAKIKWVLNKKRIIDIHLKALETRKGTLVMHLEILSLTSQFDIQNTSKDIESSVGRLHNQLDLQSTSLHAVQDTIDSVQNHVILSSDALLQNQQTIGEVRNTVRAAEINLATKLDALTGLFSQIPVSPGLTTTTSFVHCSEEVLARVLRYELRRVLTPIVERSFSKTQYWNDSLLQDVKEVIEKSAAAMSYDIASRDSEPEARQDSPRSKCHCETASTSLEVESFDFCVPSADEDIQANSTRHSMQVSQITRHLKPKSAPIIWCYRATSLFGSLRIEIRASFDRAKSSMAMTRTYDITVHFWPSWSLLKRGSISMRYNTKPNSQGYYQICPTLAIYPIISPVAPVWDAVERGDLVMLRQLFSSNLASPDDQDDLGYTLLHVAATSGNFTTCKFLLEQGADPNRATFAGETPFLRFVRVFSEQLMGIRNIRRRREYWLSEGVDQAAKILYTLESAGSDPEECTFDIKRFFNRVSEVSYNPDWISNSPSDLGLLQQWADFLRSRGIDILQHARSSRYSWWCPERPILSNVEILLACGLDPNRTLDSTESLTPLFYALRGIHNSSRQDHDPLKALRHNIAISLIRAGADIFHIEWYRCEEEVYMGIYYAAYGPLLTPTTYAQSCNIESDWVQVLKICGFDPAKVFAEDKLRRRAFLHNQGAQRTGVEGFEPGSGGNDSSFLRHRSGFRREVC
ncbi:hypothetical protein BU16DRAFT_173027 [Lophium mytilinum]|uniref:Uncharacterized protein n=1 Tax=Lophium mytilinum TaxID=390894 RepID=A0A6A6Q9U3_9PEZI|nr:hypothetical protein BU16DRAFT_173027 [Lophium mytilinum]